jgi:hypothetical protein
VVRKWLIRVFVAAVAVFAVMWVFWPWVSQITMLVPSEKELHSYQKRVQPVEQKLLQAYDMLAKDPTDQEQLAEILKQSNKLLGINQRYWVEGMRQPWYRRFMFKIRFMEPPPAYLPTWPGPKDPEGQAMLAEQRDDTATLMVYSWNQKEDSNALASQMLATFGDGSPVTQDALSATADVVAKAKTSKGDADYVYMKWKGNYRPPLSFLR